VNAKVESSSLTPLGTGDQKVTASRDWVAVDGANLGGGGRRSPPWQHDVRPHFVNWPRCCPATLLTVVRFAAHSHAPCCTTQAIAAAGGRVATRALRPGPL